MPTAGSEPAIAAKEWPQIYAPFKFMIPKLSYISMLSKPSSWKNKKSINQSIKQTFAVFVYCLSDQ
jgi:hypothetical protein